MPAGGGKLFQPRRNVVILWGLGLRVTSNQNLWCDDHAADGTRMKEAVGGHLGFSGCLKTGMC